MGYSKYVRGFQYTNLACLGRVYKEFMEDSHLSNRSTARVALYIKFSSGRCTLMYLKLKHAVDYAVGVSVIAQSCV